MRCQISIFTNKNHTYLDDYLQNVKLQESIGNTMLGHVFPFRKDTLIWGERCGGRRERRGLLPCKI